MLNRNCRQKQDLMQEVVISGDEQGFSPVFLSILEDIPHEIVVFIKRRKVIMATTMNADQRYFIGINFLQANTMADRDQHVSCAMNDISMAIHITYPLVGTQMEPQDQ